MFQIGAGRGGWERKKTQQTPQHVLLQHLIFFILRKKHLIQSLTSYEKTINEIIFPFLIFVPQTSTLASTKLMDNLKLNLTGIFETITNLLPTVF